MQGSGHERVVYFPVQHPPSGHLADKPPGHSSDPNTFLQQFELNKRTEEDDFTVPVFVNSKPDHATGSHNLDMEKLSPSGPVFSGHPNKDLEGLTNLILRQQRDSQNEENPKCIPASREHRTTSNSPSKGKLSEGLLIQIDVTLHFTPRCEPPYDFGIIPKTNLFQ